MTTAEYLIEHFMRIIGARRSVDQIIRPLTKISEGLAKITEKNRELVARNNETAIKLFEKNDQLNQESTAAARFKQNIGAVLEVSV
jgi:hypothetical protein